MFSTNGEVISMQPLSSRIKVIPTPVTKLLNAWDFAYRDASLLTHSLKQLKIGMTKVNSPTVCTTITLSPTI